MWSLVLLLNINLNQSHLDLPSNSLVQFALMILILVHQFSKPYCDTFFCNSGRIVRKTTKTT